MIISKKMNKVFIAFIIILLFSGCATNKNGVSSDPVISTENAKSIINVDKAREILKSNLPQTEYELYIQDDNDNVLIDGRECYRFRVYSVGTEAIVSGASKPVYTSGTYAWAYVDKKTGDLFKGDAKQEHLIPWNSEE